MEKKIKSYIAIISDEIFFTSFFAYIIVVTAEIFKEGSVENFIDPNIILGMVMVSGLILFFTESKVKKQTISKKRSDMFLPLVVSIVAGIGIFLKIQTGIIIPISILASLTLLLLFKILL